MRWSQPFIDTDPKDSTEKNLCWIVNPISQSKILSQYSAGIQEIKD